MIEEEYSPSTLIKGYSVYCESYFMGETCEFERAIRKIKPSIVIIYEP